MNVCICICSKFPNNRLYTCIEKLYEYQINVKGNSEYTYKIHVVDSDSSDFTYYDKIKNDYPDVELHMIKNKNYEYGAWKYLVDIYPNENIYICIQDGMYIEKYIDLSLLNDTTVYSFHNNSGYLSHLTIRDHGISMLQGCGLDYESIINDKFNLAQHNSFIINNKNINDMFAHLTIPPTDKSGSCAYERNFGIYFTLKGIDSINLYEYMSKIGMDRQ